MHKSIMNELKHGHKFVFLTGAGISRSSGLATFRGKEGLWRKFDPISLATTKAFKKDPKMVWEWYYERRKKVLSARPNPAHIAIAELGKYKDVHVLTQNVDGLHRLAGSKKIIELHGNIYRARCTKCSFKTNLDKRFPEPPPVCKKCGNNMRPDIVWFDEDIDKKIWKKATMLASECDIMIVVGTSLTVPPANNLPEIARKHSAILVEINPTKTRLSHKMHLSIRKSAPKALPNLVRTIIE
jgi:NAD-dependent deacetylase